MDNILKIYYTLKYHPDVSLFVQTSPAFCCPALITEGMAGRVEKKTGVPVVSITYDGTGGQQERSDRTLSKIPSKEDRSHAAQSRVREGGAVLYKWNIAGCK